MATRTAKRLAIAGPLILWVLYQLLDERQKKPAPAKPGKRTIVNKLPKGKGKPLDGSFIDSLPPTYTSERDALIRKAIKEGAGQWDWQAVFTSIKDDEGNPIYATVPIMADAIRIEGVRIPTNYRTAQLIADDVGLVMVTSKVADLINEQANILVSPTTEKPKGASDPENTSQFIRTSRSIDQKILAKKETVGGTGHDIVNNTGKFWVLTKRFWDENDSAIQKHGPDRSANYGFWPLGSQKPIQGTIIPYGKEGAGKYTGSLAHGFGHTDYSQTLRYMGPIMTIFRGNQAIEMSTADVLTDPYLAPLVSYEGALPAARHPRIAMGHVA